MVAGGSGGPLLSKDHQVLGTFAIYYSEPRTPGESDLRLIEGAGHIAVIAIAGERARAALAKATEELKRSEAELRTIVDAISQSVSVSDAGWEERLPESGPNGLYGFDQGRGDGGGLLCTRFSS